MIFKKGTSLGREKLAFWPEFVENVIEKPNMSELPNFALPVKLRKEDGMVLVDVMDLYPADEWHGEIVNSTEWIEAVIACRAQNMCVPIARDVLYVTPVGQLCLIVLPYREEAPGTLEELRGNLLPMDEFDSFVAHGEERATEQKLEKHRYNFFGEMEYDEDAPKTDDAQDDSFANWQMVGKEADATIHGGVVASNVAQDWVSNKSYFDTDKTEDEKTSKEPSLWGATCAPISESIAPKSEACITNQEPFLESDKEAVFEFEKLFMSFDPVQEEQASTLEVKDFATKSVRIFSKEKISIPKVETVVPESSSLEDKSSAIKVESVVTKVEPVDEGFDGFGGLFSSFGSFDAEAETVESESVSSEEGCDATETGPAVEEIETIEAKSASPEEEIAASTAEHVDEEFDVFDSLFSSFGSFDARTETAVAKAETGELKSVVPEGEAIVTEAALVVEGRETVEAKSASPKAEPVTPGSEAGEVQPVSSEPESVASGAMSADEKYDSFADLFGDIGACDMEEN